MICHWKGFFFFHLLSICGRMEAFQIYSCYWPLPFVISAQHVFTCTCWPVSGSFQDNHVLLQRSKRAHYCCCILNLLFVGCFFLRTQRRASAFKSSNVERFIRPRADEDIVSVCGCVNEILRSSAFMVFSCVTVPVAHVLLSEEGCVGLWPPGSADGEWQVNPSHHCLTLKISYTRQSVSHVDI